MPDVRHRPHASLPTSSSTHSLIYAVVRRIPRGRVATDRAYRHLGYGSRPVAKERTLFD